MKLNEIGERKPVPTTDYAGDASPAKATKNMTKAAKRKAKAAIAKKKVG